ncbi:MAG: hypothetical protein A2648_02275 [Candidatus Lloydbacteria bacterium RIFCSPHIGHO2_01_FULL_41_20]|uniref:Cell division protein FtsL n=1 Tax=Candidatus Lloydbacteria bacterium RIFCSPHIGHO2_01_FULL_41_20 TaxID=1798657 RepID=A0A1G2CQV1_9BACT|nr:MAG: hypothetical protein A2648_02275 [Candidatus Lloydbacteria bacterium RIFCSPHIGHO2_01_FULL_41_20]
MTERILQFNNEFIGNNAQKSLFLGLAGSLVLVFVIYSYFIGSIIFAVVERKQLEADIRDYKSFMGTLEVEYLNLASGITLDKAKALGFKEATDQIFISRKGSVKTLSFRGNEF